MFAKSFLKATPTLMSDSQFDESEDVMVEIFQILIRLNGRGNVPQPPASLIVVVDRLSFRYERL